MFDPMFNKLYLDLDGVLADFDTHAEQILGMDSRLYEEKHGTAMFYHKLNQSGRFYYDLPLMEDALELYDAVVHLKPVFLSGVPWQIPSATVDKVDWVRKYFGKDQPIITPRSRDKALYCTRNDVIVDDWPKHKQRWLEAGGIWIDHTSANDSIQKLRQIGVLK